MGYLSEHGIEAVCFDIDGTLYPKHFMDWVLFRNSFLDLPFSIRYNRMRQQVRKEDGYDNLPFATLDEFHRRSWKIMYPDGRKSYEYFLAKLDTLFIQRWARDYRKVPAFDGMADALRELGKHVKIGVMSDFPLSIKLEALGIADVPYFACSTEDCGHLKPCGSCFEYLIAGMGIPAERILYVGDSERKDVMGARKAGMHSMLITGKRNVDSKADLVVHNYDDVLRALL